MMDEMLSTRLRACNDVKVRQAYLLLGQNKPHDAAQAIDTFGKVHITHSHVDRRRTTEASIFQPVTGQ